MTVGYLKEREEERKERKERTKRGQEKGTGPNGT
jgi:hypothetical protein